MKKHKKLNQLSMAADEMRWLCSCRMPFWEEPDMRLQKRLSSDICSLGTRICLKAYARLTVWHSGVWHKPVVNRNVWCQRRSLLLGLYFSVSWAQYWDTTTPFQSQISPDRIIIGNKWNHQCVWIQMQREDKECNNDWRWSYLAVSAFITRNGRKTIISELQYYARAAELRCDHFWWTPSSVADVIQLLLVWGCHHMFL